MPDSTVAATTAPRALPDMAHRSVWFQGKEYPFTDEQVARLFHAKINKSASGDCWEWTGRKVPHGYGLIRLSGRDWYSHRVSYEFHYGRIPDGLHIDHLCRNRACCNPTHLEAVSCKENILRSPIAQAALNAAKTHCDRGHEFTEANTIRHRSGKYEQRACRTCTRWRERVRAALASGLQPEPAPPASPSAPRFSGFCSVGHPETEENTYRRPSGLRQCRMCRAEQRRKYNAKRRATARSL
ncbi:HNH endonuclease signature motif containing protein [Streptomyces thermolilacinus]|uniref:HNH endonuclease signature motif containing protein n=1 Tax=Streptomyces thermolilacinus TaxID=285540 RepID=UPI003408ED14